MREIDHSELRYETRVVAFIDVLGWSSAVLGDELIKPRAASDLGWLLNIFRQQEASATVAEENFKDLKKTLPYFPTS